MKRISHCFQSIPNNSLYFLLFWFSFVVVLKLLEIIYIFATSFLFSIMSKKESKTNHYFLEPNIQLSIKYNA